MWSELTSETAAAQVSDKITKWLLLALPFIASNLYTRVKAVTNSFWVVMAESRVRYTSIRPMTLLSSIPFEIATARSESLSLHSTLIAMRAIWFSGFVFYCKLGLSCFHNWTLSQHQNHVRFLLRLTLKIRLILVLGFLVMVFIGRMVYEYLSILFYKCAVFESSVQVW